LSDEIRKPADDIQWLSDDGSINTMKGKKVYHLDVMSPEVSTTKYRSLKLEDLDGNFDASFVKELIAIRTPNRTIGQARRSGSVMVKSRLTRIATDGKIFAKRDSSKKTNNRMEIIINVDLSGSTAGEVLKNELNAAKAISIALKSARIPHTVLGHTSNSYDKPIIYRIFSFDMNENDNNLDERFNRVLSVGLYNNFDGLILENLEQYFTKMEAARYVLTLSDGMPYGGSYSGHSADQHTKQAADKLRAKNINVISLSVVKSVVKGNDKLYGSEFNVDCSEDVTKSMKELVKKITL
jgi:cobalamin biosynthesis protein CobT